MNNNGQIKRFSYYIPKIIKFYGLKIEYLTPILFVLLLGINFFLRLKLIDFSKDYFEFMNELMKNSSFLTVDNNLIPDFYNKAIKIYTVVGLEKFLGSILTGIYVIAFINDLKKVEYTFGQLLITYIKRLFFLVISYVIFSALLIITGILIIVPVLLYFMFIFFDFYILDKGYGPIASLAASKRLVKGKKRKIFVLYILFQVFFLVIGNFLIGIENIMTYTFVSSFISTISMLMYRRLIGTIYFEAEYEDNKIDLQV